MAERSRLVAINEHIRKDPFANYLSAVVEAVEPGYGRVSLTVTEQMANFHGITHGAVVFALGDIAFAAASWSPKAMIWFIKNGSGLCRLRTEMWTTGHASTDVADCAVNHNVGAGDHNFD